LFQRCPTVHTPRGTTASSEPIRSRRKLARFLGSIRAASGAAEDILLIALGEGDVV
jgi:hypothetical protein